MLKNHFLRTSLKSQVCLSKRKFWRNTHVPQVICSRRRLEVDSVQTKRINCVSYLDGKSDGLIPSSMATSEENGDSQRRCVNVYAFDLDKPPQVPILNLGLMCEWPCVICLAYQGLIFRVSLWVSWYQFCSNIAKIKWTSLPDTLG